MKPIIENPSAPTLYMRKWREENREKNTAYNQAYQVDYCKKNAETACERAKKWQRDNPERTKAKNQKHYQENREERTAKVKEWQLANPEKVREIMRLARGKRRAKIKGSSVGKIDFAAVIERGNGACGICGKPITGRFDYDHIIPIAAGGPHITDNMQIAHGTCNRKKAASVNFSLKEVA